MHRPLVRAWAFLRLHGLRATLRAIWRLHVYGRRRFVVLATSIPGFPGSEANGIVFGPATAADLARLPALRTFVEAGEWVHVARHGDRIVGFRRMARSFPPRGGLSGLVPPDARRLFTLETFVHPAYRQRGLGLRLSAAQDRHLAEATGAREIVTAVDADNLASLRMNFRKGARPVCFVEAVRLLLYSRYRVSARVPRDVEHILDDARRTA
jgi:GNAT superfamily N-acetyltransferase